MRHSRIKCRGRSPIRGRGCSDRAETLCAAPRKFVNPHSLHDTDTPGLQVLDDQKPGNLTAQLAAAQRDVRCDSERSISNVRFSACAALPGGGSKGRRVTVAGAYVRRVCWDPKAANRRHRDADPATHLRSLHHSVGSAAVASRCQAVTVAVAIRHSVARVGAMRRYPVDPVGVSG